MSSPWRDKMCYRLRDLGSRWVLGFGRKIYWSAQGLRVGRGTILPRLVITWPHHVKIGAHCRLEPGIAFKFDGPWRPGPGIVIGDRVFLGSYCEFNVQGSVTIGDDALIGSGCRFIDHDHCVEPGRLIASQPCAVKEISIGRGVWLGANVVVLKSVHIGAGAVVGACAVVNRDVPEGEIWAGAPARRIKGR